MAENAGTGSETTKAPIQPGLIHLGFLTIQQEQGAWLGGYLVTNAWARPLEFRLTSAVQPSRVQQILYGPTLEPHLVADLIGKTLVEKTAVTSQVIICDHPHVCLLGGKIDAAVAYLPGQSQVSPDFQTIPGVPEWAGNLLVRVGDTPTVESVAHVLGCIPTNLDLAEPFQRLREAILEARRLGGALRTAG